MSRFGNSKTVSDDFLAVSVRRCERSTETQYGANPDIESKVKIHSMRTNGEITRTTLHAIVERSDFSLLEKILERRQLVAWIDNDESNHDKNFVPENLTKISSLLSQSDRDIVEFSGFDLVEIIMGKKLNPDESELSSLKQRISSLISDSNKNLNLNKDSLNFSEEFVNKFFATLLGKNNLNPLFGKKCVKYYYQAEPILDANAIQETWIRNERGFNEGRQETVLHVLLRDFVGKYLWWS